MSNKNLIDQFVSNEALSAVSPNLRMRVTKDGHVEFDANKDGKADLTIAMNAYKYIYNAQGSARGSDMMGSHTWSPFYEELKLVTADGKVTADEIGALAPLALDFAAKRGFEPDGSKSR